MNYRTLESFAREHGRWLEVTPAGPAPAGRADFVGIDRDRIEERRSCLIPALGVAELRWPTVVGCHGWVFADDDIVLSDTSWHGADLSLMDVPSSLPRPHALPGTCLSLCSDWASGNYGHFLLEALPRAFLFESAGLWGRDIDHFLLPRAACSERDRFIASLKIPAERIVWSDAHAAVTAERFLVASFPGAKRTYPAWHPAFLRRRFGGLEPEGSSNAGSLWLYISRLGFPRCPINEPDVRSLLKRKGFMIVEPHANNSLMLFEQASLVVGAHAAGLASCVFSRPGAHLVELLPSDHVYPYYYSMAMAAGHRYTALLCESIAQRNAEDRAPSRFDFHVDVAELERILEGVCDGDGPRGGL